MTSPYVLRRLGVYAMTHPLHSCWASMKTRCSNPNRSDWPRYGGRGIRVCARWVDNFANFVQDMGEKPTPAHTLDRIDVNGDYGPDNCRWATRTEQANNRRRYPNALPLEAEAKILALRGAAIQRDIAEMFGIDKGRVGYLWRTRAA